MYRYTIYLYMSVNVYRRRRHEYNENEARTIQLLDLGLFTTPLKSFLACTFTVPKSLAARNAIAMMPELHNAAARRS